MLMENITKGNLIFVTSECNLVFFLNLLDCWDMQIPYLQTPKKLTVHIADMATLSYMQQQQSLQNPFLTILKKVGE